MSDTRQKLVEGAISILRTRGIAGSSARTIAAAAGVNQALVFYHFGSVDKLLQAACVEATAERVALYRSRFTAVSSVAELLTLGRELHLEERDAGNVTVLAQVLAGARQDAGLAAAAGEALALWVHEVETVLSRVLQDSPIATLADTAGLAHAVAASFIGVELYEAVNPAGTANALTALEQLAVLTEILDDLGPIARRTLAARTRRTGRGRSRQTQRPR